MKKPIDTIGKWWYFMLQEHSIGYTISGKSRKKEVNILIRGIFHQKSSDQIRFSMCCRMRNSRAGIMAGVPLCGAQHLLNVRC